MRRLAFLFLTLTGLAVAPHAVSEGAWDRQIAAGILFRMERQEAPPRNVYGLRIDPRIVRAETALAKRTVYDLSPRNGREVLSSIVREHEALGGVNGDFFQFGADPGGDPVNLMVRGGELLSHPGGEPRSLAAGWAPDGSLTLGAAAWKASFSVNGGPARSIRSLNARVDDDDLTLYTDSAGYAYASRAAEAARVRAGAYRLAPDGTLRGRVSEVAPLQGRVRIGPGEFLVAGAGAAASEVRALKPGDRIRVRVRVSGFDWSRVGEVMGGGPVLLRERKPVLKEGPDALADPRHPRTAMGRTVEGQLWFVVVDGRQTMSVGATLPELTEILRRWGCAEAINLDGGGSSAMNLLGLTLNRPSAGAERPVANAVLLYGARPAPGEQRLEIRMPAGAMVVGRPIQVEVLASGAPVPPSRILFAAQGAGWIDQEGRVHPVREGLVEVTVLVNGAIARASLNVVGGGNAAGGDRPGEKNLPSR